MKFYLEDLELLHVPNTDKYYCTHDSVYKWTKKGFERIDENFIDMSLYWGENAKSVSFEKLIVSAYYKIKIPGEYINDIEILYKDKNPLNKTWYNMFYRFPEKGIESVKKGYFYIPYYTNYVVNKKGKVFDISRNLALPVKSNGGYAIYSAKRDFAIDKFGNHIKPLSTSLGRYRLVALAFLPFDTYPFQRYDMEVNHIDGVKDNDSLSNLEWVDRQGNADHAMRNNLRNDNCPVLVKDYFTNEVTEHHSIEEASRFISLFHPVNGETVRVRLINFDQKAIVGRYAIQYKTDNPVWEYSTLQEACYGIAKIIVFKNIFTEEVHTCLGIDEVRDFIKNKYGLTIKSATIGYHLSVLEERGLFPYPHQGFWFKPVYIEDNFPTLSNIELDFFKRAFADNLRLSDHRPIIVKRNGKYLFTGASFPEIIKTTGLRHSVVSDLVSGRVKYRKDNDGNIWEIFYLHSSKGGMKISEKGLTFLRENEKTH